MSEDSTTPAAEAVTPPDDIAPPTGEPSPDAPAEGAQEAPAGDVPAETPAAATPEPAPADAPDEPARPHQLMPDTLAEIKAMSTEDLRARRQEMVDAKKPNRVTSALLDAVDAEIKTRGR